MIKAVIFDLDGVLVSTDQLHFEAWKALAVEIGAHDFSEADNHRQRGVSRMASLEVVLEKVDNAYTDEEKERLADYKNTLYVKSLATLAPEALLPGALSCLKRLKAEMVNIALGSASKNAPIILEKIGIADYFDAVACGLDVTKSKPDPEVFLVAAKKLNIHPSQCLVVEDSDAGIEAAHQAGMQSLAIGAAMGNALATYRGVDLSDTSLDWTVILTTDWNERGI